ncbi:hypothetical protein [Blastococcus sp. CT_GayMR16]|uniref:hypothetical protein n=1 Tax=Blastococcus sp. CT_GayMR16 TaxID=2559607 RepID=UPI00107342D7|nr:hypothetical protein [Blastococcus sp. CT_GayMR16]TFV91237.1 hypothetical protein E4P38_01135 [Blastococcus sp. CT_GayMR16]
MAAHARAIQERERHLEQTRGYPFLVGRGPKASATVRPAPLRYWQYDAARSTAVIFVAVVVTVWLGLFGWVGGSSALVDEAPLALGLGLVVLLLSTCRFTVSDHGVSTDVAGSRTSPGNVVPLMLVRDVRLGDAPADWPSPTRQGGRWPGRQRVAVRHLAEDGQTDTAFTHWVRDPAAFAAALGHPL